MYRYTIHVIKSFRHRGVDNLTFKFEGEDAVLVDYLDYH